MYMCLKFNKTAKKKPLARRFPCKFGFRCYMVSQLFQEYLTSLQDREKQDSKQESIVLEMNVVHDQETGMKEERCRY